MFRRKYAIILAQLHAPDPSRERSTWNIERFLSIREAPSYALIATMRPIRILNAGIAILECAKLDQFPEIVKR